MTTTPLNRQNAASRARLAQALLGVLLVGGGAALAVGLHVGPRAQAPATDKLDIPGYDLGTKGVAAKTVAMDPEGLAERFNLVANAPKPVVVPPADPVEKADATTVAASPVPPPAAAEVRYLGAVMGSKTMALISDAGRQRFVAVGDPLSGGTVESITDGQIKIKGDTEHTIELATRSGDVLTKGHARTGQPPPNGGVVIKGPNQKGMAGLTSAGTGINGEEIPPTPEYIRPDQAARYEQLRSELRGKKQVGSEAELAEYTAKILSQEDPKAVNAPVMEKMRTIDEARRKGGKQH